MQQRGVALVLVLMIVALVSVIATEMGARLQYQVKRVSNIKDNNQAYWYAMGAEQYATKALADLKRQDGEVIHLNQPWAAADITFPLEGGGLQAKLRDMQSCFNLNALRSADANNQGRSPAGDAFKRLLQHSSLEIPSFDADVFADAVLDWLDADGNIRDYGAEDSEYESMLPPYLPANANFATASELRMIKGADPKWLKKLLPLVCVLPGNELKININTLDESMSPLLQSLLGNIGEQEAKSLITSRKPDGYRNVDDFLNQPDVQALNLSAEQKAWFDVTTSYFLLQTRTRYNNASFAMSSLLHIQDNMKVDVLRREFGGFE
ncbi:type II secretion system minor pseudopilin GspK [Aliiglaciecola sp. CAU 1673]|uniref:type II secretion system minor pseudopilin GspK n=1 Tax=Aliiglaciecola sp. CAU 1673 TaxID=3032595 RepID=UPI0023DAB07F|nr:type II secretion system minor pseudopilin GspK [Aliiglaciecola sp. CAU 1673]MDF2179221.1 type II secretion system minor pseudopilin GspK [Aliiglaciecola sp. CAU 1673]